MAFSVEVKSEKAERKLRDAERQFPGVNVVAGRAGANTVRNNFFRLEREHPNKMDWPRQHFWAACARATSFTPTNDGALVHVSQIGARQRWKGGPIAPRKTKYLTIPARAEGYGKRARELDLKFGFVTESGRKRRALLDADGNAVFWLVRNVNQKGDPSVVPTAERIRDDVAKALRIYLGRKR